MYVTYQPPSRRSLPPARPAVTERRPKRFLLVMVAVLLLVGFYAVRPHHTTAARPAAAVIAPPPSAQSIANMDSQIQQILNANPTIDISITAMDLHSGQTESYGPAVPYEAASVGKLITAGAFYKAVETGRESMGQTLEDGDSASAAMQKMIVDSDNTAWQSLNDELGDAAITDYAASIGIPNYTHEDNLLTTTQIAGLLQKLYRGELVDKTHTSQLLGYMHQANESQYILPAVPVDATVYHKAGLLDDRVHDAAIITNPSHAVAIVIFTNGHGSYDFPGRASTMQRITTTILDTYGVH